MSNPVRDALHKISLCSQNSMSSKEECGRIARAALAASEQGAQPVAYMHPTADHCVSVDPTAYRNARPLYTHPQPAQEPLTDERVAQLWRSKCESRSHPLTRDLVLAFARAVERAHGIGEPKP